MHLGDVDSHAPPSGVIAGQEGHGGAALATGGCLLIFIAIIVVVIVLPALLWTAGIACGSA